MAIWDDAAKLGGQGWQRWKEGVTAVGQGLMGGNGQPGLLGYGKRPPNPVPVREDLAQMPGYGEDRSRNLAAALAAQGRQGPQMQGAQLAGDQQAQARGQQNALAQLLMAQANGTGPSLAQGQLQRATDNNIAQTMALGQSMGRGSAPGLAMRNIQQQSGQLQQQAAGDSSQLRLQEQMQAQNSLGQLLAGMRGQDIGFAAENANLTQGANGQNLAALLQQRGMNDQMSMGYERNVLGLGAQQGNMNMDLARLLAQTGLSNEELAQGGYDSAAQRRLLLAKMGIDVGGNAASSAGSAIATTAMSDERAKTNIVRHAAEALPGVPFASWDYLPEHGGQPSFGVIAQDLERVAPQFVHVGADGFRRVDYSFLSAASTPPPVAPGARPSSALSIPATGA